MTFIASALPYIQIVLSVLLVAAVLLQRGDPELGSAFGSSDSSGGSSYFTRRGFEKTMFNATIVLAILFVISALVSLVI
jgi:preprotein translocase subunit SecG